ncbi:MAG: MarR family winged helix-turn-helix transcriptional regulator [Ilumatobacteraceae bacterium]|nr:MarR family winged helix-turn-helix transcriptional regulator [Ilumatobacteraceae bacterium]
MIDDTTSNLPDHLDDTPWLSPDELRAWITLAAFLESVPTSVEAQLKRDAGMNRFEYSILAMLSEEPGHTLAMSDLAQVAFGSLSRLSHAVSRLEQRGLVTRCAGAAGRRHNVVRLTDDGLAALESAAPRHAAEVRRLVIDPLDDAELAMLPRLLSKMIAAAAPDRADELRTLIENVVDRNHPT